VATLLFGALSASIAIKINYRYLAGAGRSIFMSLGAIFHLWIEWHPDNRQAVQAGKSIVNGVFNIGIGNKHNILASNISHSVEMNTTFYCAGPQ
jgi:hypothetical protein